MAAHICKPYHLRGQGMRITMSSSSGSSIPPSKILPKEERKEAKNKPKL